MSRSCVQVDSCKHICHLTLYIYIEFKKCACRFIIWKHRLHKLAFLKIYQRCLNYHMHMYVYAISRYVYTYLYYMYVNAYVNKNTHAYIYIYTYICIYRYIYRNIHTYVHLCIHINTCYIFTYIHT